MLLTIGFSGTSSSVAASVLEYTAARPSCWYSAVSAGGFLDGVLGVLCVYCSESVSFCLV